MTVHLVTGITGFLGRHLAGALLARGEQVWGVVRPTVDGAERGRAEGVETLRAQAPGRLHSLPGDLRQPLLGLPSDAREFLGRQRVILWHLAADLSFRRRHRERVFATNVKGTRQVVHLANALRAELRHVSTAFVCGRQRGVWREEALAVGQVLRNQYEESKFQAEQIVRNEASVPTVIYRPAIVIGDAYEGKAAGCTFGYYRFAYMFELLRRAVVGALTQPHTRAARVLRALGTRYQASSGTLTVPWLVIPYPRAGTVNVVPLDYVITAMLRIGDHPARLGKTFHLTHPQPPSFRFLTEALLADLGYRGVHYRGLPPRLFAALLRSFTAFAGPLRVYTRSLSWYLPYIAEQYAFDRRNTFACGGGDPPPITQALVAAVNRYAREVIFPRIAQEQATVAAGPVGAYTPSGGGPDPLLRAVPLPPETVRPTLGARVGSGAGG